MASPEEDLGKLIFARTPYTKMELPGGWDTQLQQSTDTSQWYFRGQPHQLGKALRIPVTVTMIVEREAADGTSTYVEEKFRDHLLIGYEGAGGY